MLTIYWKYFLKDIDLTVLFHGAAFEWDYANNNFRSISGRKLMLNYCASLVMYIYILLAVVGQYQIVMNHQLKVSAISLGFTSLFITGGIVRFLHIHPSNDRLIIIVRLYNSMLHYEQSHRFGCKSSAIIRMLMTLCIIGGVAIPICLSLFQLIQPCTSPLVELLDPVNCSRRIQEPLLKLLQMNKIQILVRLICSIVTLFIGLTVFGTGILVGTFGIILKLLSFYSYVIEFKRTSMKGLFKTEKKLIKGINQNIKMYKQIQLMVNQFNESYQWIFFAIVLSFLQIVWIVCVYSLVKSHSQLHLLGNIYLVSVISDVFVVLGMMYSIAGLLNFQSLELLQLWRTNSFLAQHRKSKLIRKNVKSCMPLKIKVGSLNFISRLTPFKIINLCLHLTVKLLAAKIYVK